jgi:hypothetical protein
VLLQDVPRVFKIPHRVILDMLLANLGMNPAHYDHAIHEDKRVRVTVNFNTAALNLGGSIIDISVPGEYCLDNDAAEDSATIKAVRYIETMTNTVVRDINYAKTKRQQNRIGFLENQLKESDIRGKKLARGWLLSTRYMYYFSEQMRNAAAMNLPFGDLPDVIEYRSARLARALQRRM